MKQKMLSIFSLMILFLVFIGCGGEDSPKNQNSTKQTMLTVEFQKNTSSNTFQKASVEEISEVRITITKESTVYLDNVSMSKNTTTKKWGIGLNLDTSLTPYNVQVLAKNSVGEILYKTKIGSTLTDLVNNPVVILEEVVEETTMTTSLPSVTSITHNNNGNTVNIHFIINNATAYELTSESGGTFNTPTGTIASSKEATLDVIYTRAENEAAINLKIKLINSNGDSRVIPFIISENILTVNFPPLVKVNVEEQLIPSNTYKITATVIDQDSTSWTYDWSKIRGANVLSSDALDDSEIEIESIRFANIYPLCFALTVTDDTGAVSNLEYCIKNADDGFVGIKKTGQVKSYNENGEEVVNNPNFPTAYYPDDGYHQSGLAPQYQRNDTQKTVTDHIHGLIWQDDESVSTTVYPWEEAKSYCENLSLGSYKTPWRLPTRKELVSLLDFTSEGSRDIKINSTFQNHSSSEVIFLWSSTYYTTYYNGSSVYYSLSLKGGFTELYDELLPLNVRCVRTKL